MTGMIERVAWAIERAADDFSGDVVVGRQFQKEPHPESLAMARAAIEAMREPTETMWQSPIANDGVNSALPFAQTLLGAESVSPE